MLRIMVFKSHFKFVIKIIILHIIGFQSTQLKKIFLP